MCRPSGPRVDTTATDMMQQDAERARQAEIARQTRVKQGTQRVNDVFGQFDNGFFKDFRDTQLAYYRPQLDQQFGDARDQLTYSLANAGTLNSTMAADQQGRLSTAYQDQLGTLMSNAKAAATGLREQVAGQKSAVLSQLNATGDSSAAANEALSRTRVFADKQPAYSPLGDVLGGAAAGIGAGLYGQRAKEAERIYFGTNPTAASGARIVR